MEETNPAADPTVHLDVVEKETIDEVIFRTTKIRSRLILEQMAGCIFRSKATTDFGGRRPPISVHADHSFRLIAATDSGEDGRG